MSLPTPADAHTPRPLQRLLAPRSIAIVGASADDRSFGGFVLGNLRRAGYGGALHLVSRSSTAIDGLPCVASIDALPEGVDLAVLAIPEAGVLDAVRALAQSRCHAAVLFASGYAEAGEDGQRKQLALAELAQQTGLLLLGPNCMGFTNRAANIPITFEPLAASRAEARPGIAVLAQSGFMAATLRDAFQGRGLPVTAVFSTGNEVSLGIEDALAHFINDAQARVIAVYAEQLRRPALALQLARQARLAGKPIVLLMPGRSARARQAALSHTGALAGDHASAAVALQREGVLLVQGLDELFDCTAILLQHPQYPQQPQGGSAFVTGSGAMKNIALDLADDLGLDLPALSPPTVARLTELLPAYAVAENPLDYTTIGVRQPGLIGELLQAMLADPLVGSLVLAIPVGPEVAQRDKAKHIVPALAGAKKPALLVLTGDASPVADFFVQAIADNGVLLFRSVDRALKALARVAALGVQWQRALRADAAAAAQAQTQRATDASGSPAGSAGPDTRSSAASSGANLSPAQGPGSAAPPQYPALPAHAGLLAEHKGKAWLAQIGVPVPAGALALDVEQALQIARRIGWPVVIKAQAAALPHKTEAGGVIVNLADEAALRAGWQQLQANIARHRPGLVLDGVLVEAMGPRGLELVVGARRDANWGPVLLVGLGGVWIEALKDVRLLPPDLALDDIVAELQQLKAAPLLHGLRGAPGVDLQAIAHVVALLGAQMLADEHISEIDINPLLAYPDRVLALDALLVLAP